MFSSRTAFPAALAVMIFAVLSFSAQTGTGDDGIIRVKSAYSIAETVARAVQDGVIRCRLDHVQLSRRSSNLQSGARLRRGRASEIHGTDPRR